MNNQQDNNFKINNQIQRQDIENDNLGKVDEIETVEEKLIPPEFNIKFDTTCLTAYLTVKVDKLHPSEVTPEEILEFLQKNKVSYGIEYEDIKEFCESRAFYKELIAANGLRPVDGKNGKIVYHCKTDDEINLRQNEFGQVNYKELGLVENVKKDDVLATIVPPEDGKNGINIFGIEIPFKKGLEYQPKIGENTVISEDKTKVLAGIDGCVKFKNNVLSVSEAFIVDGDVDSATGNLDCVGSIIVNGDVREGFSIKAGKDIVIKGMAEGATIVAEGNVTISNGIQGMQKGNITANGNIISKYIEFSKVRCNGSIYADVILNSDVKAGESIIVKGAKACIVGGNYQAGKMIYANFIGSDANIPTSVSIQSEELSHLMLPDSQDSKENDILKLKDQIVILNAQQDQLQDDMKELSRDLSEKNNNAKLKQTMLQKNKIAVQISKVKQQLEELESKKSVIGDYKIVALKRIYIGTKVCMSYFNMNIEQDMDNVKFFPDKINIVSGSVLPSDRI